MIDKIVTKNETGERFLRIDELELHLIKSLISLEELDVHLQMAFNGEGAYYIAQTIRSEMHEEKQNLSKQIRGILGERISDNINEMLANSIEN